MESRIPVCEGRDRTPAPYENLTPVVQELLALGNRILGGGTLFYRDRDGWRCDLVDPIDFVALERRFVFPDSIERSRAHDSILDRLTWVTIQGGLGEKSPL